MEGPKLNDSFYSKFGKKVISAFNGDSRVLSSIQKLEKIMEDEDILDWDKNVCLQRAYWGIFFQVYLNQRPECIKKLESYVNNLEKEISNNEDFNLRLYLGTFYEDVFQS